MASELIETSVSVESEDSTIRLLQPQAELPLLEPLGRGSEPEEVNEVAVLLYTVEPLYEFELLFPFKLLPLYEEESPLPLLYVFELPLLSAFESLPLYAKESLSLRYVSALLAT